MIAEGKKVIRIEFRFGAEAVERLARVLEHLSLHGPQSSSVPRVTIVVARRQPKQLTDTPKLEQKTWMLRRIGLNKIVSVSLFAR